MMTRLYRKEIRVMKRTDSSWGGGCASLVDKNLPNDGWIAVACPLDEGKAIGLAKKKFYDSGKDVYCDIFVEERYIPVGDFDINLEDNLNANKAV